MKKLLLILPLLFWIGCEEDTSTQLDDEVVGTWDISTFTIDNISYIQNRIIILFADNRDSSSYFMDGRDWYFQDDGDIFIDEVTPDYPDGTGNIMKGNWETSNGNLEITFDEETFTNIYGLEITATYFNGIDFQYEIFGETMMLTSGDIDLRFQKK